MTAQRNLVDECDMMYKQQLQDSELAIRKSEHALKNVENFYADNLTRRQTLSPNFRTAFAQSFGNV